jgi:hypothetical protein
MNEELGLFEGQTKPDPHSAWSLYEKGLLFNQQINLDDTIRSNRNFFIGKQWEGVQANGLPTPVFNILKRVVGFIVASITTDNLKLNATTLENMANKLELQTIVDVVNDECAALMEHNEIPALVREFARNAAVDGSGCLYSYWDPDVPVGNGVTGAIKTETVQAERVFFGNPNDRNVQSQPSIQISFRELVRNAKLEAKANKVAEWRDIQPDMDENTTQDSAKITDDKVTVLLTMWRDDETGEIWGYKSTQNVTIFKPKSLGIHLYPICWLPWDYVQDCYHGEAMITGLIPNQIFINKAWAMSMLSIMRTAWPKVVYDKTKVRSWDNRVGGAIGVPGDVGTVAKIIDPASIDPQIAQFIKLAVEQTEQSLGATAVALGDTRPDNTSAIIALQRAASTPSELTKQNIYKCVEDLFRIYIEFMANYYNRRMVDLPLSAEDAQEMQAMGVNPPATMPQPVDFSVLQQYPMMLKLDVGASSYYSEIAAMQTLDNLLASNQINIVQYLERIPDSYMPAKRALIEEKRQEMAMQQMMAGTTPGAPTGGDMGGGAPVPEMTPDGSIQPEIPTGGGYGQLQRAINAGQNVT